MAAQESVYNLLPRLEEKPVKPPRFVKHCDRFWQGTKVCGYGWVRVGYGYGYGLSVGMGMDCLCEAELKFSREVMGVVAFGKIQNEIAWSFVVTFSDL